MISSPLAATVRRLDPYRSLINPLWSTERRGVIESVRPLTATAAAIVIRTNRAWAPHRPGQFVTLGIEIDGVRHQRCYSLTSVSERRGAQLIEIGVQRVDGGLVSTHLTERSRPGDLVHLDGPTGDFTLPDLTPDRLLFISAGSGITPIMGMLRSLAARPPHTDVVLLHHAPSADRTMFAVELNLLATTHDWLTVVVTHTRAALPDGVADTPGRGHLDAARLDELCPDWRDREAFVCGPNELLGFATDHWSDAGALERLHLERFTPASPPNRPGDGPTGTVAATVAATFSRSAVLAETTTATTLLVAAEAAGVAAPFGCRNGVCRTCSTRLVSGCVSDVRDGRMSDAGSHVQLCVTTAVGDVTLDL